MQVRQDKRKRNLIILSSNLIGHAKFRKNWYFIYYWKFHYLLSVFAAFQTAFGTIFIGGAKLYTTFLHLSYIPQEKHYIVFGLKINAMHFLHAKIFRFVNRYSLPIAYFGHTLF